MTGSFFYKLDIYNVVAEGRRHPEILSCALHDPKLSNEVWKILKTKAVDSSATQKNAIMCAKGVSAPQETKTRDSCSDRGEKSILEVRETNANITNVNDGDQQKNPKNQIDFDLEPSPLQDCDTRSFPSSKRARLLFAAESIKIDEEDTWREEFAELYRMFQAEAMAEGARVGSSPPLMPSGEGVEMSSSTPAVVSSAPLCVSGATTARLCRITGAQVEGSNTKKRCRPVTSNLPECNSKHISPQDQLEQILEERGYPAVQCHGSSLDNGYYNESSPLQHASFGTAVIRAAQASDVNALASFLRAGLSPNPCNNFGDSVLNIVCRRGHGQFDVFKCMLDHGATLQVADGFGRTAMHYAAWAGSPCFQTVALMLERQPKLLFLSDRHGKMPLDYVTKEKWSPWIDFLKQCKDIYWPCDNEGFRSERPQKSVKKNAVNLRRSPPDPVGALPIDVAVKLSSGMITPEEAMTKQTQRNLVTSIQGRKLPI